MACIYQQKLENKYGDLQETLNNIIQKSQEGQVSKSTQNKADPEELQSNLTAKAEENLKLPSNSQSQISDEHYEAIREKCSKLRTELTDDLISRRRKFWAS